MITESIATLALLLLSAFPLLRGRTVTRYLGLLILVGGVAIGVSGISARHAQMKLTAQQASNPSRPIQLPEDGFVSSRSCRACHPHEYSTWHSSYHRTMTQVASPESVVGNFDNVSLSLNGQRYGLFRREQQYGFTMQDGGESKEYQVVMTTGSHHMQFYWYATGQDRRLGKLPFVYLITDQKWVPADSTFLRPPNRAGSLEHGQWNQNCINCHTTHGKPGLELPVGSIKAADIRAIETTVSEFGIACEACHGPGEEHVRINGNPVRRYSMHLDVSEETSIVHPKGLDWRLSSQVCGQCHSVNLFRTKEMTRKVMGEGFDFRAGKDLFAEDSERLVVRRGQDHPSIQRSVARDPHYFDSLFWKDGMVRVTGREFNGLIDSPCYQHGDPSKGIMSCMSCHDMHPDQEERSDLRTWADDQLKPNYRGNQACLQCHDRFRDAAALADHTHHKPESSGSQCYNCHMPHTSYGLLKGIRSHTISNPSVEESVRVGRPNACNLCHLDKTLQWTADHLLRRYEMESPNLTDDQKSVSASVLWTLEGDAGLRVLMAWHFGWRPAMQASGTSWTPPYLALLMKDPYDAVRYVAHHSLMKLPGFERFQYDFVHPDTGVVPQVTTVWRAGRNRADWKDHGDVLMQANGTLIQDTVSRLLRNRDQRPVLLNE